MIEQYYNDEQFVWNLVLFTQGNNFQKSGSTREILFEYVYSSTEGLRRKNPSWWRVNNQRANVELIYEIQWQCNVNPKLHSIRPNFGRIFDPGSKIWGGLVYSTSVYRQSSKLHGRPGVGADDVCITIELLDCWSFEQLNLPIIGDSGQDCISDLIWIQTLGIFCKNLLCTANGSKITCRMLWQISVPQSCIDRNKSLGSHKKKNRTTARNSDASQQGRRIKVYYRPLLPKILQALVRAIQ